MNATVGRIEIYYFSAIVNKWKVWAQFFEVNVRKGRDVYGESIIHYFSRLFLHNEKVESWTY